MNRTILGIISIGLIALGNQSNEAFGAVKIEPPADWLAWQAKRRESVAGTNGWTTLIARHWLMEGRNFVGSNPTNHAVLPRARVPGSIGAFILRGHSVRFEAARGILATIDDQPVRSADLQSDTNGAPTILFVGALSFVIIERGERVGLRVRDPESPASPTIRPGGSTAASSPLFRPKYCGSRT